ncbi:MAG: peptidylprolyl isomerase [Gammaproteobacteria bacterium]|nr:MAG: peptidylprolyl isomerase [Gammaproteobacteria bacterium]
MMIYLTFKKLLVVSAIAFANICSASINDNDQWRALNLNNTVLLTLPHGKVVIELAPQFSPQHVKQFSTLVKKSFYDGAKFYRVIDGFVAQAGPKDGSNKDKSEPILSMEGEFLTDKNWSFTQVQNDDLFAKQTGFKQGFALAKNNNDSAWLTHCPGTLAMARGNEADSATSHFYFVIGQAPRYLDKIMTIFGRVVYGMQHIQAIQRTSVIAGEKAVDNRMHTPIVSMKLMANVPVNERLLIEVENTESSAFTERVIKRKARENAFFYKKPPPVLDVCQVPIRSRLLNKV